MAELTSEFCTARRQRLIGLLEQQDLDAAVLSDTRDIYYFLYSLQTQEGLAMVVVADSAKSLKGFLGKTSPGELAQAIDMRMVLAVVVHRRRMTCSQATSSVATEAIHQGQAHSFSGSPSVA